MNLRIGSMVISILIIGVTLISLGMSYANYKDDLVEFNEQRKIEQEKRAEETKRLSELAGYPVSNFVPDDFDMNPDRELDSGFKTKLIIHLSIIGFIILSEIGLLTVLPKDKKDMRV